MERRWVEPYCETRRLHFLIAWARVLYVQAKKHPHDPPVVAVVDDDASVRAGLSNLLRSVGYEVRGYGSSQAFLASDETHLFNCLILDVRMPVEGGFDLQHQLANLRIQVPIIFITGHADVPMSVRAMKGGAIDFLSKPFRDQDLLEAVAAGVKTDLGRRESVLDTTEKARRLAGLTAREREVMMMATAGKMNKQIAFELGLSEITVKIHRGKVMRKLQTRTFADLVRLAEEFRLHKPM
ncbi:response regulator transcription factor [Fertoebacter nigrum]|uniref:Response regulator transcription factor n=2 Tax=Fertoeibacter niger TaxID=2656921 RepID=A0A8X8GX40_9RHOB|nr:response regulator transcription factor [Fertoeibacter niger]